MFVFRSILSFPKSIQKLSVNIYLPTPEIFFCSASNQRHLWLCTILMLKQRIYRHVNTPSHPFSSCTDNSLRNIWHLLTKLKLPHFTKNLYNRISTHSWKKKCLFSILKKSLSPVIQGEKKAFRSHSTVKVPALNIFCSP